MLIRFCLALLILLASCMSAHAAKILWVGAHPDDESLVAPYLKSVCASNTCTLLVLTQGEGGTCGLSGGCSPNLAAVRATELDNTAAYLNATPLHGTLANVTTSSSMNDTLTIWSQQAGGTSQLYGLVANAIQTIAPDVILTFDYRHGSTCHPDHRAAGYVVMQAAQTINFPATSIYVDENIFAMGSNWIGLDTAVPSDTNVTTASAASYWTAFTQDFALNPSQFTASQITAAGNTPTNRQIMSIMSSDKMQANDPLYTSLCH